MRLGAGVSQTGMSRDELHLRGDNHDAAQLIRNAVAWMTRGQETLRIGRHPSLFGGPANLMTEDGHSVSAFRPSAEALAEVSVYFANARTEYSDEEIEQRPTADPLRWFNPVGFARELERQQSPGGAQLWRQLQRSAQASPSPKQPARRRCGGPRDHAR